MAYASYFLSLAVLLAAGITCYFLAKRAKVPIAIFLVAAGAILGSTNLSSVVALPQAFIIGVGIIAIALVTFDSASKFRIKEMDSYSSRAIKFSLVYLPLVLILLSAFCVFVLKMTLSLSIVLASIMAGTAFEIADALFKTNRNRVFNLLSTESRIATPILLILPFAIIEIENALKAGFSQAIKPLGELLIQQALIGVGTGIIIGLIIFKAMKKKYSRTFSPIFAISAAILSYVIAESISGSGLLAALSAGIFYGAIYVKGKEHLNELFSSVYSSLEILVFIILGIAIRPEISVAILLKSALVFAFYLFVRNMALQIALKKEFSPGEKAFLTLMSPKGLAVAVVIITISAILGTRAEGASEMLSIAMFCMLYSMITSFFASKAKEKFLSEKQIAGN